MGPCCCGASSLQWIGILTEYLSHDAGTVRYLLGDLVITSILALACVMFGLIISLYSCYPLSLVILGCIPLILFSAKLTRGGRLLLENHHQLHFNHEYGISDVHGGDESQDAKLVSTLASSMVQNARSVVSLGLFKRLAGDYSAALQRIAQEEIKPHYWRSFWAGVSQFVAFGIWALAFWCVK